MLAHYYYYYQDRVSSLPLAVSLIVHFPPLILIFAPALTKPIFLSLSLFLSFSLPFNQYDISYVLTPAQAFCLLVHLKENDGRQ